MTKHYASISSFDKVLKRESRLYNNIYDWHIQEKIDGMNMSIVFDPSAEKLELRGRTTATQYDFSKVALPSFEEFVSVFEHLKTPNKMIFYGELCGGGIQKKWYFDEPTFVLFDVEYVGVHHSFYYNADQMQEIGKSIGLKTVPSFGTTEVIISGKDDLTYMEKIFPTLNPSVGIEGVVAKPLEECLNKFGERVIYKTCYRYFDS